MSNYDQYIKDEASKLDLYAKPKWFAQVLADLERHEGFREFAYPDPLSKLAKRYPQAKWGYRPARDILAELGATGEEDLGKPWTVGIGFTHGVTPSHRMELNVAKRRLSIIMLEHSVELDFILPDWRTYPVVVQGVLVNMMYNMGRAKMAKFNTTLNLLKAHEWANAGHNLKKSLWYKQVKSRGVEMVNRLITGKIEKVHEVKQEYPPRADFSKVTGGSSTVPDTRRKH